MREKFLNLIADANFSILAWIVVIFVVLSTLAIGGIWSPQMLGMFYILLIFGGAAGTIAGSIWGGVVLSDYHTDWSRERKREQRFLKERRFQCDKGKHV